MNNHKHHTFMRRAIFKIWTYTPNSESNPRSGESPVRRFSVKKLTRISHTFSDSSHTLHDDLAFQVGEAVLHEHCPRPLERQSQSAERRSVQKKCEKCGLKTRVAPIIFLFVLLTSFSFPPSCKKPSLLTVGGGRLFAGPHHSGGVAQIEYRASRHYFSILRPQASLIFPEFSGLFLGVGIGIDWYCTRHIVLTPSFEPGVYRQGRSRNLGCPIEFRSSIEIAYETTNGTRLGLQFFHLSNASLGKHNPGMNALIAYWAFPLF
jgi:lipid A 3-O-deacylase